jgi:hypothetical protein
LLHRAAEISIHVKRVHDLQQHGYQLELPEHHEPPLDAA